MKAGLGMFQIGLRLFRLVVGSIQDWLRVYLGLVDGLFRMCLEFVEGWFRQNFGLTTVDLRWFDLYSGLVEICCFSFGFVQDWLPSSSLLMLGESCFKALVFVEQKW